MPVLTLQRSYKYIMYATKQPSLRIKQADLKCKSGCGFYGTAEADGYCSKCYRNHMDLERQKKLHNGLPTEQSKTQMSGFSKFEEKKRQQIDKKNKYLKSLPVFRKTSNVKDTGRPEKYVDIMRHTNPDANKLMVEFISLFGQWGEGIKKDFFRCIQAFSNKIISELDNKPIDDLAENTQNYYNLYHNRVNSCTIYENIPSEIREKLVEFFEKYSMTTLYSFLFCPSTTNDEEKDLAIQERIRKLSWVNAHHLDCCISETSIEVRDLVYTAINDLLGMDSMKAPQEKLACVVKCCRSVVEILQHCQGGPVSADEFLPALIFIVLKANPARLKSNILYLTRFCKDSRLMQGETGYYFTNLCCAVSFIENLTAESLNMSEQEFKAYMSGELTVVSAWESALVACEGMHQLCNHLSLLKELSERNTTVQNITFKLNEDIQKLKQDISENVSAVLSRTPLIIKQRKSPLMITLSQENLLPSSSVRNHLKPIENISIQQQEETNGSNQNYYLHNLSLSQMNALDITKNKLQLDIRSCLKVPPPSNTKKSYSNKDILFPIVDKSVESITPDDNSYLSLSKVNYDIDFSDLSTDNSIVEDLTPDKRKSPLPNFVPDPFSPTESSCPVTLSPLIPSNVFLQADSKIAQTDNFVLPFLNDSIKEEVLDNSEQFPETNLPTPLKPVVLEYSGFSKQGSKIPSIPCSTKDFGANTSKNTTR